MKLSKEFKFFTFLLESYAKYKGVTAAEVLKILDEKNLTDFLKSSAFPWVCKDNPSKS